MIKYYGGKKWLSKIIKKYIPNKKVDYFVDLFVGGGSISDCLCGDYDNIIINDKDENLINLYSYIKNNSLEESVKYFEQERENVSFEDVKTFRKRLFEDKSLTSEEKAFLYYSCVYCGYSGKPYASPTRDKYNQYKRRDIKKDLTLCKNTLSKCNIKCCDYNEIKLKNAFYYCDPPYAKVGDNTYYGNKGELHKGFDHNEFFEYVTELAKDNYIMISYEDSGYIRELYKDWNIIELNKKTVNWNPSKKVNETLKTDELMILNY